MCKIHSSNDGVVPQKHYAQIGNVAYALNAANTLLFCGMVIFFKNSTSIFDATWAKDGFCVSNATIPYWTSHDLCLYADIVGAAICGLSYLLLHKKEGMEKANGFVYHNLLGILFHGFAHGMVGAAMRGEKYSQEVSSDQPYLFSLLENESWMIVIQKVLLSDTVGFWLFWIFLLKAAMKDTGFVGIIPLSFLSYIGSLGVRPSFGFTYTQTVLLIAFAVNQLNLPKHDKGFEYVVYGLFSLPVGLIGWAESTICSSTIIHYGGHLLYDAYIPLSMLSFYLTCYFNKKKQTKTNAGKVKGE